MTIGDINEVMYIRRLRIYCSSGHEVETTDRYEIDNFMDVEVKELIRAYNHMLTVSI